jgi:Polyketide cyclase / dehydrase and lipid transport
VPDFTESLEVAASPESIWAVATDFERYGEWNTAHRGLPGRGAAGAGGE